MSVANGTRSVHNCHVSIGTAYQGLQATLIISIRSDNVSHLAGRLPRPREVAFQNLTGRTSTSMMETISKSHLPSTQITTSELLSRKRVASLDHISNETQDDLDHLFA